MAGKASLVDGGGVRQLAEVRVVTGEATDARIAPVVALAHRQPIRLKAHVRNALGPGKLHRDERPVAGSAEVVEVARAQLARIEDVEIVELAGGHGGDVIGAWAVAGLAGHARD